MEKTVVIKKNVLEAPVEVSLPSDVGSNIQSIVFNSRSIKPNPFITKQSNSTNRL